MVSKDVLTRQIDLEKKLLQFYGVPLNPFVTAEDFFGNFNAWACEVGQFEFFINPMNGRWLYYDKVHDGWEDTTFYAGGAVFIQREDGEVEVEETPLRLPGMSSLQGLIKDRSFGELEESYLSLRAGLDLGKLTLKEFEDLSASLRLQDEDGTWWQVRPGDGSWLKWDGKEWAQSLPLALKSGHRGQKHEPRVFMLQKAAYIELKRRLSAGELTEDHFAAEVNHNLRCQTSDGTWWQIRASDGRWLLWDGAKWSEAVQPLETRWQDS